MMTAADLRYVAYAMCNFNAHELVKAGVLIGDAAGNPAVGGSDWARYNSDPLTFIIKLPEDRLEKLAALIGKPDRRLTSAHPMAQAALKEDMPLA